MINLLSMDCAETHDEPVEFCSSNFIVIAIYLALNIVYFVCSAFGLLQEALKGSMWIGAALWPMKLINQLTLYTLR